MNIPQTSVAGAMTIGIAGQICDSQQPDVDSVLSEEASAEIPFSYCLKQGTADNQVLLPTATTDKLKGFAVHGHGFERLTTGGELGTTGLKPKAAFGLLKRGRLFVVPTTNVTPNSEVHIQVVSGGGAFIPGTVRGTRSTAKTIDVSAFCRWLTTTTAGSVARLEVDFTNAALATADS